MRRKPVTIGWFGERNREIVKKNNIENITITVTNNDKSKLELFIDGKDLKSFKMDCGTEVQSDGTTKCYMLTNMRTVTIIFSDSAMTKLSPI